MAYWVVGDAGPPTRRNFGGAGVWAGREFLSLGATADDQQVHLKVARPGLGAWLCAAVLTAPGQHRRRVACWCLQSPSAGCGEAGVQAGAALSMQNQRHDMSQWC